jgi:hypothetical protein
VAWVATHSLPSHFFTNFFMEKFHQRALYRIIFAVCFWSGLINWTSGPQPAYIKMSTTAQRDRWCKPAFTGQEASGIILIQGAYPHELLFRCQIHECRGCVVPVTSTHIWNRLWPELSLNWSSSVEPSYRVAVAIALCSLSIHVIWSISEYNNLFAIWAVRLQDSEP